MASKWSLNERTARKLDKAASAAVKDALDTMDALKAAEEGGSVERAEKVSGMSEEELFSFAEYDPHKGEKIGYTGIRMSFLIISKLLLRTINNTIFF